MLRATQMAYGPHAGGFLGGGNPGSGYVSPGERAEAVGYVCNADALVRESVIALWRTLDVTTDFLDLAGGTQVHLSVLPLPLSSKLASPLPSWSEGSMSQSSEAALPLRAPPILT